MKPKRFLVFIKEDGEYKFGKFTFTLKGGRVYEIDDEGNAEEIRN